MKTQNLPLRFPGGEPLLMASWKMTPELQISLHRLPASTQVIRDINATQLGRTW